MGLHEAGSLTTSVMGRPLVIVLLLCFAAHVYALPIEVDPHPSSSSPDVATSWTIVGSIASLSALLAYVTGKIILPMLKARRATREYMSKLRNPCRSMLIHTPM